MKIKHYWNILLLCFCCIYNLRSQIIYIKPNATGNGTSWANAQGDLRQALKTAPFGAEIWVAQGTYYPTTCSSCTENDRKISFEIPDGVAVYGGFNGTETSLSQRNWNVNKTIISGDIDGDTRSTHNTYNVFYLKNVSALTILDGFTITGGNADFNAPISEIYTSGAAIYNDGRSGSFTNPTIRNCTFSLNFAVGVGGAIFNSAGYNGSNQAQYIHCQFNNNISQGGGGAVCNWGVYTGSCNPKFEFCQFTGNKTDNSGGAILSDGQAGTCEAQYINCQFYKNEASLYGGAIYNLGKSGNCTPTVTGCLFWSNKAFSAAGIYCLGSENGNSSPRITNCIFYKNEATTGGSVYSNAGEDTNGKPTGTAKPTITNCIIWKNTAPTARLLRNINSAPTISYSIVDTTSCSGIHSGVGNGVTCENGMIYNQDPLFNDPDNGDFHLRPESPAINTGLNTAITSQNINYDLDSLTRIVGNTVDIGAWEFNPSAQYPPKILLSPESTTACVGDTVTLKMNVTGSQPLYFQWYKNNIAIPNATANNLVLNAINLSDSGAYKCIVRNDLNKTATTEDGILKIKEVIPLSISISLTRNAICQDDTATFKADIKNGGQSPTIEWRMNGTIVGTGKDTFTTPIASEFHRYTCKVTSSELCASPKSLISNEITVPIAPRLEPKIVLSASTLSACLGDKISFSTSIENGGTTPQYQWYINNNLIDNRASTWDINSLKDGDKVKTVLKSAHKCPTQNDVSSNELSLSLKNRTLVGVLINANKTEICQGDSILFKAIGTGGGMTPQYHWYLNDNILSNTADSLILKTLKNKDKVKATYTSSESCTLKNPVESDSISITVNESIVPTATLTISKSTICKGERVQFELTGKGLGSTPQYAWLRNGKPLDWDKSNYATDSLKIDDAIQVKVQTSNACALDKNIVSNTLTPRVRICLYNEVYGDRQALVYPNPSSESITYVGLVNLSGQVNIDIFNQKGQPVYSKTVPNVQDDKEVTIDIPNLPNGLYIVKVVNGDFISYKKWLITQ